MSPILLHWKLRKETFIAKELLLRGRGALQWGEDYIAEEGQYLYKGWCYCREVTSMMGENMTINGGFDNVGGILLERGSYNKGALLL